MTLILLVAANLAALGGPVAAENKPVEVAPTPADFVNLSSIDVEIKLDIRYATRNNFTKKIIYPEAKCVLRREVAEALSRVQSTLKLQDLGLKVYDCYRPLSLQRRLWQVMPDERFVANPGKGSSQNRGASVDVTLVDTAGRELEMPSAFDDFSEKASRNYRKGKKLARKNRATLEKAMVAAGFIPLITEWWHFDYRGWEKYPLEDRPLQQIH